MWRALKKWINTIEKTREERDRNYIGRRERKEKRKRVKKDKEKEKGELRKNN